MSLLMTPEETIAIQIPFKVRLEPYLVESLCELSRLVREKGNLQSDISGLLFGKADAGNRTVEALKTFVDGGPHSDLARRERMERAYKTSLEEAKNDPELSKLDVVGWFSFRNGSGLLSSDVVFHNQNFRKAEDLALIVWREGPSQITAEVYSKSDNDSLTADDYRWGSVRLSADIRHMNEPIDLAMRVKLADDSYLRTYDGGAPESQFASFIRKAEAASDKLLGLVYKKKEEEHLQKVRGLIGDGRLPSRSNWPPEAPAVPQQAYFNPYAETAKTTGRMGDGKSAAAASAAAGAFGTWSGAGASVAPAHNSETRVPLALTSAPRLDLGRVGQMPYSGRTAKPEVGGLPMVLRRPKKPFPWPLAAGLFVVCSGAVFAFLSLGGLQSDGGRIGQAFHTIFPGGELNLRVRSEDSRLRLTWNQRNHSVASAIDATLQIFDGQVHRDVHLDGRQVADGSVLYRPVTNDVTFRLEVRGEQGGTSGSVRVLDGLSGQETALDVSAPATQPNNAAARPAEEPYLLADAAKDAGAPTIIRHDVPDEYAPLTDGTYPAVSRTAVRTPAGQTPGASHYETPLTIGSFPTVGGSTINSWDPPSLRSRSKQRNSRSSKPAVAGDTGFVAPRPLMQVMPRTSTIPNGTIQSRTRVQVQVRVDPGGKVESAHVVGAPVNETIASAALTAARQWTFEPASNNGQHVESDHTIVFEFRPER